jgi:hypothetical protein
VAVVTPGDAAHSGPDGAFDVHFIGGRNGTWPVRARWPADLSGSEVAVVVGGASGVAIARVALPGAALVEVAGPEEPIAPHVWAVTPGRAAELASPSLRHVGMSVPINPLAARNRHNGLGFTDYVLVLSDRRSERTVPRHVPTALAAWLAAGIPSLDLVVVEDATATAYHSRSWRGQVAVDTRTDLHRLLAHARTCVDLCPGEIISRECVESMLLGTPVIVPRSSRAVQLSVDGAGLWFSGPGELLRGVEALAQPEVHRALSARAQELASSRFGDSASFVRRVGRALGDLRVGLSFHG